MSRHPGRAMNAARISRPRSVRTGMFCRFGSFELNRPVAVETWSNDECTRPSLSRSLISAWMYVLSSFWYLRYSSSFAAIG